jgi:Type II secretory pathway, ATPase PulE/Tfp pilus assembly pathway, ATPase PilB
MITNNTDSAFNDASIIRLTNAMLTDAIKIGASDLHFEPYEATYRIRLRIDGILREHSQQQVHLANRFTSSIKILAQLDISEKRLPQDGHFKMHIQQRLIDFRVSSCPTLYGEKIVIRILDPINVQTGIDHLGYEPLQRDILLRNITRSHGMILATGPTGSGKTMSLYSILNMLNLSTVNISTVEDPIEINMPGINQVNINLKAGLDFATVLRSFLRQDPDVIMVGEIRDLETAQIAVQASHTGHLVLSTLHTNSAVEALSRLVTIGVPAYNAATAISLIISQRLCRKLCNQCKVKTSLPYSTLLKLGFTEQEVLNQELTIFTAIGCQYCHDGYKGRIGIYEMLEFSSDITQIIMTGGTTLDIAKQSAIKGNATLRQAGLNKIRAGITTIYEVDRVTNS